MDAVTADLEVHTGTNGVVVAQGGRFGGWSLYVVDGVPAYAYNFVGRDLTTVRGSEPITPGRHDLVVRFEYDGGHTVVNARQDGYWLPVLFKPFQEPALFKALTCPAPSAPPRESPVGAAS